MKNKKGPLLTDENVGNRVRLRRLVLGLSQTTLGDKLGVSFQQVQKYERGANRISASRLHDLARALSVQPEFFFEGEMTGQIADSVSPDYVTQLLATEEGLALIRAFQKLLTIKMRRKVVGLVEELADRQP